MNYFILIYNIDEHWEMGGGEKIEFPKDSIELDRRVEEIMIEGHELIVAGKLEEYKYKTIEVVKKVVRE